MSRIAAGTLFLLFALAPPIFSENINPSRSYDDLLNVYMNRSELLPESRELETTLLAVAEDIEPIELWRSIKDPDKSARVRAANGLALVQQIFPGGDPGQWDEVTGFWFPRFVPKPLAAFDAVYYTSIALLELDEDGAAWIAQRLFDDLRRSSRAALLAIRTAPLQYTELISRIRSGTGLTPIGGWPAAAISGNLPFAHRVSSFVTQDRAMISAMVFLNAAGQPVSGMGPFAWDRKKGILYRVVETPNDIEWWLIP